MIEHLEFGALLEWFRSLGHGWMFLPILILVIAVVGIWSNGLLADKYREPGKDKKL